MGAYRIFEGDGAVIGKEEILGFAREVGLDPNVVEKDLRARVDVGWTFVACEYAGHMAV